MAQAGEIRFDAIIDTSDYDSGVKDIQTATRKIEDSAEQADKAIGDVGKNAGSGAPKIKDAFNKTFDGIGELADGLGVSLPGKLVKIASIGGALAAVGGVFKTGIDTAISQIDVQGTLDAQLGKGSIAAQNAGKVAGMLYRQGWGDSLADVANVASNVSSVIRGIGEKDLGTVTKATEVWAQTFDADAGESVRGVKVLMEKFGLSAQDATDLMTKGMQNGLNYTDELGDNLSEYSGRWAEAGTSAQEYFSLLQAGVDSGAYQLDKVGDFLNEFLTSLVDGRMEKGMSDFSQGTQDVFNEFQNGRAKAEDVLNAVIGELSHMTDKTKEASIASSLWSSLGEDNAMGMIEALANVPNSYQNIKGATDEAADSTMSIGQKWEAFKRTMTGTLGDAFTPFVTGFLDGLTGMSTKFADFVSSTDWSGLSAMIGQVGAVIGAVFNTIGNLIQPTLAALRLFSDWFSANKDWIIGALVGIGTAFAAFKAAEIIVSVVTFLRSFSLAAQAAQVAQLLLNSAMLANPIGLVIGLIAGLVAALVWFFTQTNLGKQMWQDFCNTMSTMWTGFTSFIRNVWNMITGFFTNAGNNVKNAWQAVCAWFAGIPGRIVGFFAAIGSWFGAKFGEAKNAVISQFTGMLAWIGGVPQRIIGVFAGAGSWLLDAGSAIINGLLGGLRSAWDNVTKFVGGIGDWIVKHKGPLSYDKRMLVPAGQAIMDGLAKGLASGFGVVQDVIADANSELVSGLSGQVVGVGVRSNVSQVVDKLDGLDARWSGSVNVPSFAGVVSPAAAAGNMQTVIKIENMNVRSDNDIRLIAQELNRLQKRDMRRA